MALNRERLINGVYNVGPVIGHGGFSSVYLAMDVHGKRYAVKTEKRLKQEYLITERDVYMRLCEDAGKENIYPVGFPRMHYFDEDCHGDRILVMDCLGKTLADIISWQRVPFSIKTVLMIGIQVVRRLECLHGLGLLHGDIKPENLLTGVGEERNLIYVCDFGLALEYIDWTGQHKSKSSTEDFCATPQYACIEAHKQIRQSRRSDLENLAYTLVYLGRWKLPWTLVNAKDRAEYMRELERIKDNISAKRLCDGLPSVFAEFVRYVRGLGYSEKPEYEELRNLFKSELEKRGERNDGQFDWL